MKVIDGIVRFTLGIIVIFSSFEIFAQEESVIILREYPNRDEVYPTGTVEFQGVLYDLYDGDIAIVKKVSPKKEYVVIPSTVKKNGRIYTVTEIGNVAFFEFGENVTKVVKLPNTIVKIQNYAFSNSHQLTKVIIPDSVTEIGEGAFLSCNNLKHVELPNKLKVIKRNTFLSCTSLESITIPSSVEIIEPYAFAGCHSLEKVYLLNNKTKISTDATPNDDVKIIGGGIIVPMKKVTMMPVFNTQGEIIEYEEYK